MSTPRPLDRVRGTDNAGRPTEDLPPERQRSSIPSFLFLSFILFMLTNGRGDEMALTRNQYKDALQSLNYQMSNYSAWLNGTASNFTLPVEDPATMPLVDAFLNFGPELDPERGSYYSNLTGFWHGDLQFHNLTSLNASEYQSRWSHLAGSFVAQTNISAVPERLGPWNWTNSNKGALSVGDKLLYFTHDTEESKEIAMVHGKVDLTDPKSSEELRLDFEGVHILSNGSIYAFAEPSGRHIDIRMIPSLVPETKRNSVAHAIEVELAARITKLKEKIDSGTIDQDSLSNNDSPKTRCSFKLFAQVEPSDVPLALMQELEDETDNPTGIPTITAPELKLSGVLISQDCGILYEIQNTTGLKSHRLYQKITTYSGFSTIINLTLLALLKRQVWRSSSAVGLSRVSRYAFLTQSLIDAISFVGHITLGILADGRPSLSVLAPAGVACLLFIYEAQFAVLIGQIQAPEDVIEPVRPPAPNPAPAAVPSTGSGDVNGLSAAPTGNAVQTPTPATNVTPTEPPRQSFWRFLLQHIRTDPSARLWTLMSLFLIFVFRIVIILSLPLFFVGSLYSFIWFAQIYRSARRGRSSGLSTEYLVGTTICRLFFVLYFLGCPKNILDVETRNWIYGVACLMFIQVFIIMLQDTISPTFFLPGRMSNVQTYDYHPPMPLPDPEAPEQTLGDCAICMDAIQVDPALRRRSKSSDGKEEVIGFGLGSGGRRTGGILGVVGASGARKSYSLAPCHHLFHTACLERWLAIKNICPQCRRPLPPL